ncbi:MAG: hypothetical protein DMG29_03525 [Acidobacteria bacterium]|nr:MAG: hypothetical protein DMG29_03525 [Acidobacteriota bacterium]
MEEVIATFEEAERTALLNICQQPLAGIDCIQPHHWITELLVRDYERHGRNSWMLLDIRAQAYGQEIIRRKGGSSSRH